MHTRKASPLAPPTPPRAANTPSRTLTTPTHPHTHPRTPLTPLTPTPFTSPPLQAHFPLRCEQLDAWEDKNTSDAGTGQWMQAHTKRCRKCHARVEKNGGCNWISCRCGHQFCYFCFGTEQSHHNVVCNAPPTAEAAGAKSDLEYYMHYFDRWHGHCESQKLEGPLRQSARDQMDSLMHCTEAPRALSEVQHLGEAAEALIDCRRLAPLTTLTPLTPLTLRTLLTLLTLLALLALLLL